MLNLLTRSSDLWYRNPDSSELTSGIHTSVDEIEDNLYYCSDVISSGVPELGRLITESILDLLVFPLLLPAMRKQHTVSVAFSLSSLHFLLL